MLLPTAGISVPTEPPCLLGAALAGCLPPALSAPATRRAGDIQDPGLEAHPHLPLGRKVPGRERGHGSGCFHLRKC